MSLFEELAAPFPTDAVSWRIGSTNKKAREREENDPRAKATKGSALAYIDARDVMDRLDAVCGPEGWCDRYEFHGPRTVCYLSLRLDGEWITKADGAGDSDVEAEKGAISDALKRAAVKWGVGRYLYSLPAPWVELDDWGKITQAGQTMLEKLLDAHTGTVEWGSPSEKTMARALYQTIKTTVQTADAVRLYREQNQGVLAGLRKVPREHIESLLERIIESDNATRD